jgi:hypothetical protein
MALPTVHHAQQTMSGEKKTPRNVDGHGLFLWEKRGARILRDIIQMIPSVFPVSEVMILYPASVANLLLLQLLHQ